MGSIRNRNWVAETGQMGLVINTEGLKNNEFGREIKNSCS